MPPRRQRRTPQSRRSPVGIGAGALPFIREQREAESYTAKWHRVNAWAEAVVTTPSWDSGERVHFHGKHAISPRVQQWASSGVRNIKDAEEAFDRGIRLEEFGTLPNGPRRELGGYRRVTINAFTWKADEVGEVGYDPAWITLGWGMTAHEAQAAYRRFVRDYERANAVVPKYKLIVTALEVKFWTQSETADEV